MDVIVWGPGNIAQAHTVGEWIEVVELERAVRLYRKLVEEFCVRAEGGSSGPAQLRSGQQ